MLKRNRFIEINLLLLSCFLSFSAYGRIQPAQLHFYTELVAPFYWLDEHGNPQGAAFELAQEIIKEIELESTIDHLPWARAFHDAVNSPNIVLLTALKTPERTSQLQWLGKMHTANAYFVGLADNIDKPITSLAQAKSYRIGTIRGYGAATYLKQQGFIEGQNLELLLQPEQLWTMLYKKRIDFVLSNLTTGDFEIKKAGFDPDQVKGIYRVDALTVDLEMATGNSTAPKIVEKLRQALQQLKNDGRFQAIMRKWKLDVTPN